MDELKCLAREFRSALEARLSGDPAGEYRLPSKEDVATFCRRYLDSLFPLHHAPEESSSPQTSHFVEELELLLSEEMVSKIRETLPKLAHLQATDLQAALKNDPAATGLEEVLLSYPGVEAITVQRLAHELYQLKVPYLPRLMTEIAHSHTGIDIHPGAAIDESFFIDHGTGVVIG